MRNSRRSIPWLIVGPLPILLLWLAACGTGATPTESTGGATKTQATQAPAAAATAAPAKASSPATAASPAAAPKQAASGDPIKIGLVSGTSGVYAALGQDQVRGAELAAEEIGSLLGRPVQVVARDDKLNPQEAAKQASELVSNENVTILTGCVSAATTLAVNEVAKRANIMYLGTCQTNQLNTAKDGGPHTFHFTYTPYQQNRLVDEWVYNNLGKKWFVLIADYAWGHENLEGVEAFLKEKGAELAGTTKAPLGTTDFSSFIPQIRAAQPEVLYVINAGADQAAFLKQAKSFGLDKEMKIYNPVVDIAFDALIGWENLEGTYGGTVFDWQMQDTNPRAKQFVEAFAAKFQTPPTSYAALQYVAIKQWAEAVKKAGSLDAPQVSEALNGSQYETPWGQVQIRSCDRQVVMPIQITVGRSKSEADQLGGPFAEYRYREIVTTIPGSEDTLRSCQALGHGG